ncbi:PucR family transcriptional regulator [Virgibacillus oceani]
MYITVKDILEMEAFKEVEFIAGASGLQRRVQNVYFMEVPDIYSFVDENGLLLTTLFPIADNQNDIKTLIPRLAEQNLAGIAIKPGRYINKIPAFMVEQADHYHFPLIKLHYDANLSTLTNHILSALLGIKTSMLEFRDQIHGQLLNLLLEGADLKQFVISMGKIVHEHILVFDNDFRYVQSSIDMNENENEIKIDQERNYSLHYSLPLNEITVSINDKSYKNDNLLVQPIQAGKENFGYMVVLIEKGKSVTDTITAAVGQATIFLAFLFQTENTIIQRERGYLGNFIQDIFNERYVSQPDVIEKAKIFNWNFHFPITILNIKLNIKESKKRLSAYYKMLDSGLIERIISHFLDIPPENFKVLYYNDSIICFISLAFESRLKPRLREISKSIISNFKKIGDIAISISDMANYVDEIKESYEHSILVHNIHAGSMNKTSFIEFYDELGLYKLFYRIKDKAYIQEFVEEKLGEILAYDQKKDAELMETVKYLIKNNGNLQKTANDMYIHYNTLRYRVNKLKELGIDMKNGFDLTEVSVALELHQYSKFINHGYSGDVHKLNSP